MSYRDYGSRYIQGRRFVQFHRAVREERCMLCGKRPVEDPFELTTCYLYVCRDCEPTVREEAWTERVPCRPYARPHRIPRFLAWSRLGLGCSTSKRKSLDQPKPKPALEPPKSLKPVLQPRPLTHRDPKLLSNGKED